ncbi:hypothetical protein C8A01DRAFT_44852 [Parachaetomium inaequale]|uniref:Uncharacterized protein n=1 Tax=Parachaetomium inaequale TaxID=2588326 RepID=A0AAN6PNH3_9PEZI|nr:hypothetical protein C8A01DRAFT_44852 [Parachaetomium inaequale]
MGTRHLICIFWKGKWVIAQYGQFDGYPDGQGAKIVKFLAVARNIDNLKAGLEHHIYQPTTDEIDAIWAECEAWDEDREAQGLMYDRRMFGINQLYPSMARETSAGILGIIARASQTEQGEDGAEGGAEKKPKKIPVHLELEFANNTLFCEWAYVIDLDKEVLEVYGGGERKHDGHRFKDVGAEGDPVPAFICSFDFSEIYLMKSDKEFVEKVKKASDERAGVEEGSDEEEVLDLGEKEDEEGEDGVEGSAKGSSP